MAWRLREVFTTAFSNRINQTCTSNKLPQQISPKKKTENNNKKFLLFHSLCTHNLASISELALLILWWLFFVCGFAIFFSLLSSVLGHYFCLLFFSEQTKWYKWTHDVVFINFDCSENSKSELVCLTMSCHSIWCSFSVSLPRRSKSIFCGPEKDTSTEHCSSGRDGLRRLQL